MIEQQRDGAVMALVFARPERRHAITAAMYAALADGLEAAAADRGVRVALIHGDATGFTAGNDLSDFLKNPPQDEDAPVMRFLRALGAFPKPLLAAVTGSAIGVGTTLLLHCDVVYAAEDATFALPFVNLGLCPEASSTFLLPAVAGYQRAAEKLLFGEPFGAAEAREMGLVNRVLPAADVIVHARERAQALATRPLASLLETRRLMRAALVEPIQRAHVAESASFRRMLAGPAAREAFAAFLQKRPPDFSAIDGAP